MSATTPEAVARSAPAADPPEIVRVRPAGGARLGLAELWRYRELVYFLTWRDVKVRYKQTLLGAAWAVVQPVMLMAVFTLFFGRLIQVPSDGVPYAIFALAALVPWTFFSNSLTRATGSLLVDAELLRKVYFPRLAIPISAVLAQLLDLAIAFAVLLLFAFAYDVELTTRVLWLPALCVLAILTAFGAGLWFSALNVQYRDVGQVLPFLVQLWMFASPVVYPYTLIPERWRALYALNPMVGVVEGFRWGLLGTDTDPAPALLIGSVVALAVAAGGVLYFRRVERDFADVI